MKRWVLASMDHDGNRKGETTFFTWRAAVSLYRRLAPFYKDPTGLALFHKSRRAGYGRVADELYR